MTTNQANLTEVNSLQANYLAWASLFLVIFLDVAGIILVLPVLTPLILHTNSLLLPPQTSTLVRDFFYGITLAIFPLFMFFSTPILGDLSDKFGRKKLLMVCVMGSAISYFIAAIGVIYHSLFLLLLSRALGGLTSGTQPIATAAIIDMSTSIRKTKNLAWVVFVSSLGLILGPAIGGITAEKNVISWFGYDMPFFFAGGLSVLNAIMLHFTYTDERKIYLPSSPQGISLTKGFTLFIGAFTRKKFRLLSLAYFCFALGWGLYYQTINWFFMQQYHYSVGKLGLFVSFIGLIFAFATSVLMRIMLKLFPQEIGILVTFVFIMAIANLGAGLSMGEKAQWLWVILNASGYAVCFTVVLSIFSSSVGPELQGWIMGVTGAIGAMTWAVAGAVEGPLGYVSIQMPMILAGILCLISFVSIYSYRHYKHYNL